MSKPYYTPHEENQIQKNLQKRICNQCNRLSICTDKFKDDLIGECPYFENA